MDFLMQTVLSSCFQPCLSLAMWRTIMSSEEPLPLLLVSDCDLLYSLSQLHWHMNKVWSNCQSCYCFIWTCLVTVYWSLLLRNVKCVGEAFISYSISWRVEQLLERCTLNQSEMKQGSARNVTQTFVAERWQSLVLWAFTHKKYMFHSTIVNHSTCSTTQKNLLDAFTDS